MKKITLFFLPYFLLIFGFANAGVFSSKQARTLETKGTAVIMSSGAVTTGIEKSGISILSFIDIGTSPDFRSLQHDNESGWTKCRVPLKSELSWQGVKERSLVFDCRPITYF